MLLVISLPSIYTALLCLPSRSLLSSLCALLTLPYFSLVPLYPSLHLPRLCHKTHPMSQPLSLAPGKHWGLCRWISCCWWRTLSHLTPPPVGCRRWLAPFRSNCNRCSQCNRSNDARPWGRAGKSNITDQTSVSWRQRKRLTSLSLNTCVFFSKYSPVDKL